MTLTELSSPTDLQNFINGNDACLVTFSAHWCGPCRASKPDLERMAKDAPIPFGITYEDDLGDFLQTFAIRAFPTYVMFVSGKEAERVEGVNFVGIQNMISSHAANATKMPSSGGNALGGGGSSAALSPEEARALRLAKLGGGASPTPTPAAAAAPSPPPASAPEEKEDDKKPEAEAEAPAPAASDDTADDTTTPMETDDSAQEETKSGTSAVDNLDKEALQTLTESMGFTLLRAQKGLLFGNGSTVESAVEWLMEHQDDVDIDEPISEEVAKGGVAQSYKCNDCGKILSNMANLELHANKTGHSDFEESTEAVKPLTPEEKAAKIAEIKELLKLKRQEREEAEKVDGTEREKQRRFMGKEMAKTREQMEIEQRKRDAIARRKEKEAFKRERERIRAELAKDKLERQSNKGKLSSKLGVDGYNPDGIQYDAETEEPLAQKPKKSHASSAAKIDEYIAKVSSYRAGGDGGKCLKVLKAYVGNLVDKPEETKFRTINTDNKAFKTKVKPFLGAKNLLLAVGFAPSEDDSTLLVLSDDADPSVLADTKEKLEAALQAFA